MGCNCICIFIVLYLWDTLEMLLHFIFEGVLSVSKNINFQRFHSTLMICQKLCTMSRHVRNITFIYTAYFLDLNPGSDRCIFMCTQWNLDTYKLHCLLKYTIQWLIWFELIYEYFYITQHSLQHPFHEYPNHYKYTQFI